MANIPDFNLNDYDDETNIETDEAQIYNIAEKHFVELNGDILTGGLSLPSISLYGIGSYLSFADGTTQSSAYNKNDILQATSNIFSGINTFQSNINTPSVNITHNGNNIDIKNYISNAMETAGIVSELNLLDGALVKYNNTDNIITEINKKQNEITVINPLDVLKINLGISPLSHIDINSSLSSQLTSITANIANLSDNKQNIINISNKLPITNIDLQTSALSFVDINSSLNERLTTLNNTITNTNNNNANKQDTITIENKLPITFIDLQTSALSHIDINSSLNNQLTTINTNINTLKTQTTDISYENL